MIVKFNTQLFMNEHNINPSILILIYDIINFFLTFQINSYFLEVHSIINIIQISSSTFTFNLSILNSFNVRIKSLNFDYEFILRIKYIFLKVNENICSKIN